jgi:hypothetical protein
MAAKIKRKISNLFKKKTEYFTSRFGGLPGFRGKELLI